ncbi:MAG: hypothetical protein ACD_43C00113G0001 [uncultured bacterium]|nr:MAG: hypothetical protein ACD_43C00113G0001 [uncultured bacterium]
MLNNRSILQRRFQPSSCLFDFTEQALLALKPQALVHQAVQRTGKTLSIQGQQFDLSHCERIFVLGAGKATMAMAEALVEILGERITNGIINVPQPTKKRLSRISIRAASHPYPDQATLEGTQAIYDLAKSAKATDLVICLISGGGSSMLALPLPGIHLSDKISIARRLMHASADILDLNTVRKHCSAIKGGRLAQAAAPATVVSLIISDVIGDRIDTIASGPTVPDTTTTAEALTILDRYQIANKSLRRIVAGAETPKQLPATVHNFIIGNNQLAVQMIAQQAKTVGLNPLILTSCLRGEAKEVAQVLTAIAHEVEWYQRPIKTPALLLAGGETTVTVLGKGHGGRNQELVLAAVPFLSKRMTILSLATDGVDGNTPTPVAGAIADGKVADHCVVRGINYHDYLYSNNSFQCLKELGCLLRTGPTGTNVGDIMMLLIK